MTGWEDKLQWLADNIDRILLVLTNIVTIVLAIYHWWKQIRVKRVAQSMIRGVEEYATMPNCENTKIKDRIEMQALMSEVQDDLNELVQETVKKN